MSEYVTFFSKFKDVDLQAVVEFVLVYREKSAKKVEVNSSQKLSSREEKKDSLEESKASA